MIAIKKDVKTETAEQADQVHFLELLPQIERCLRLAFRHLNAEAREEAIAEATANCFVAHVRLCQRGRREQAFASALARFAARQVSAGRKVGGHLNVRDPLSRYAQRQKGISVERLDRFNQQTREWLEPLVEDRRAAVPDQVAVRIDVPAWFAGLSRQKQKVAKDLAMGCSTSEVAQKHKLSSGRISQIRKELCDSWNEFHEKTDTETSVSA